MMRVIWSFGGGALALLEHGPNEGDSDYGIRSPEYLAVKGCRAVSGMPGGKRHAGRIPIRRTA